MSAGEDITDRARVSKHYLGSRGRDYAKGFDDLTLGRIYQTHYFRDHCSDDSCCWIWLRCWLVLARQRIGVQANPQVQKRSVELSETHACPIELHQGLETLADNSIDVVISNHCLEHVLHPLREIQQLKRVLKPGARAAGDDDRHVSSSSPLNLRNVLSEANCASTKPDRRSHRTPRFLWKRSVFR